MEKLNLTKVSGATNVQNITMANAINSIAEKLDELITFVNSVYGANQAFKPAPLEIKVEPLVIKNGTADGGNTTTKSIK